MGNGGCLKQNSASISNQAATAGISYAPEDPALPKPWKGLVDDKTGYVYYWNPETNITQYEKPVAPGHTSYAPVNKSFSSSVQKSPQGRYNANDNDDRYSKASNGSAKASVPATRRRSYYSQGDVEVKVSVGYGPHTSNDAESIAAGAYRQHHEISVTGDKVPQPFTSFEATGFAPKILREGWDVTPDEVCQFHREVVTRDLGLGTMSQMRFSGSTSTHSTSTSQFPSTTFSTQIAQLQAELQQTQQREAALQAEMEERRQREAAIQAELKEWRRRETEMETRQSEMQQQLTRILQFFQSSSRMFNSLDGMSPPPPTPTPTPTPVKLDSAMEVEEEMGSKEEM